MCVNASKTAMARIALDQAQRKLIENGADLMYSDTDSIVFGCKKGVDHGLEVHPTVFGKFKNEIDEGQRIKLFVVMSSKNYSYEVEDVSTKAIINRVTKIRGLCLSGKVQEQMDTQRMLAFVQALQQNKKIQTTVPQMRLIINSETKRISAKEIQSLYTNFSNQKRFYNSEAHPTKMWPYGTTSYV